jgi:hypothetical protein
VKNDVATGGDEQPVIVHVHMQGAKGFSPEPALDRSSADWVEK